MSRTSRAELLAPWLLCLATACGAGRPGVRPPPPPDPVAEPEPPPEPEREPDPDRTMIAELNQAARAGAVTETRHGIEIHDPFRALEKDTERTTAWIEAQNGRTERALAPHVTEAMRERLEALLSIGVLGTPKLGGERVFYTKREGEREQPALYVATAEGPDDEPLVDPLSYGERAALDWHHPSPDGEHVAFGISHRGDERSTLHLVSVADREVLDLRIPHTKWTNLEWLPDGSGFYYTRYPKQGEPDYDPDHQDSYFPRIFFHELGTDPDDDPRVFGAEEGTDFPGMSVSDDGRWLVINVFRGWSASDVYLFDRGRSPRRRRDAPDEGDDLVTVVEGREAMTVGHVHDGRLYLLTNDGAPRWKVDVVPAPGAARAEARRTLVEETGATLDGWAFTEDRIALHYIEDVRSRVRLYRYDGREASEIDLPVRGSVSGLGSRPSGERLVFELSSYLQPPTVLSYDTASEELATIDRIRTDVALDRFELEQVKVPSTGGVQVPVQLVRPKDMQRNGDNPVLLTGYGGFNISLLPSFTRYALYWLERGGVFAVANLRGGNEFGEQWHRAGNLENKVNAFEDMEAVIRWMSDSGVSEPSRIAITGRSNGGLLMGAMITRAPDAFEAAVAHVGLYDMVRYTEFPPAELWVSEYGDPEKEEPLRWLHAYSPYHNVEPGTDYPAVLVETADHDSRVHWAHSTKFAARLQQATASDEPIYFYMERKLGHGAGTRRSDLVRKHVRMFAFLESELELGPVAGR